MKCDCCALSVYYAERVVVLRLGVEHPCRKKSDGSYFKSYKYDDGRIQRVFHQRCMADIFDMADAEEWDDMKQCGFCKKALPSREMFFQFLPGIMNSTNKEHPRITIDQVDNSYVRCFFACFDCVVEGFVQHLGTESDAYEALGMNMWSEDVDNVDSDVRRYDILYDKPPRTRQAR